MGLFVKVIPLMAGTAEPAGEPEILRCPNDVEPDTVLSFVTQKFGEPIETAWTSTEQHARIASGWIFASSLATPAGEAIELLCVPLASTPDGSLQSMFEIQADLHLEFEQLARSGAFDDYTVVESPQREYRPVSLLGDSLADGDGKRALDHMSEME